MALLTFVTKPVTTAIQPFFRCQSCCGISGYMVLTILIMQSCSWHGFPCFYHILRIVKDWACSYIKVFIARKMSISPPEISKYFDGSFLKKYPSQKPNPDIINEPIPIINAESKIGVCVNFRLTPAANASILVANPIHKRHFQSIQQISSSFSKNDSIINFNPRHINIKNTSHLLYGRIKCSTKSVKK